MKTIRFEIKETKEGKFYIYDNEYKNRLAWPDYVDLESANKDLAYLIHKAL